MNTTEVLSKFGFSNLEEFKQTLNIWIVSRFYYKEKDEELLTDTEYTLCQIKYSEIYELGMNGKLDSNAMESLGIELIGSYLNRVYEEDDFPYNSFKELGFSEDEIDEFRNQEENYFSNLEFPDGFEEVEVFPGIPYTDSFIKNKIEDMVNDDPPKSIKPLESFREVYEWFNSIVGVTVTMSLKIDGINIRCFYINGRLVLCCTRGRSTGEVKIYTKPLSWKVPLYLEKDGEPYTGIVRGELYVELDKLEYLRGKYKAEYKVPRTAASTMAQVRHEKEDYEYLKYITFNMSGNEELSSNILRLKESGFNTVPFIKTRWIGGEYHEFSAWLKRLLNFFENIESDCGIKCDGLVAEIDDRLVYEDLVADGMYNGGNIAIKLGKWAPLVFEATLIDFEFKRQSANKEYSLVGIIEPTQVDGTLTVSRVNMFNWSRVIENDVKVGDKIKFYFKSGNSIDWIYNMEKITMKGESE